MFRSLNIFFRSAFLGLIVIIALRDEVSAQTKVADDYAFFLYNFARHSNSIVEKDQFTFIIMGNSEVANSLKRIGDGKKINGKTILVHKYDVLSKIGTPQILFVSSSESANLSKIIEMTKDKPVIVITEKSGKLSLGPCSNCGVTQEKIVL